METQKRRIIIVGSTGSIGSKALEVIADFPDRLEAAALSAHNSVNDLAAQAANFSPNGVCVSGACDKVDIIRRSFDGPVWSGPDGLVEMINQVEADVALISAVGSAGLRPTLAAIERELDVALANKEALVTGGGLVMDAVRRKKVRILPIDSEHNAVAQCLIGERRERIRRVILTASGGAFRDWPVEKMNNASVEEALCHPTWDMGPRITIDSATMMNKGFEVIEAMWLFDLPLDKIEVIIHPQSVLHSMVEFIDGSIIAQLGVTDMYFPIQNILLSPDRVENKFSPLDLADVEELTFKKVTHEKYPCLDLAFEAARIGGVAPAVLNGADEVAIESYRAGQIRFGQISELIAETLSRHNRRPADSIEAIEEADRWARETTLELTRKWSDS